MSMSKKDFIALADAIKQQKPIGLSAIGQAQVLQWEEMVSAIANFCKQQNPRFMRERWLGYIAGENGKNGGTVKK